MLHIETVESRTFSLLKDLMALTVLERFSLVGGTALSLHYGHRSSDDLDLFCHEKFSITQILHALESAFGTRLAFKQQQAGFGIFCFIDDIKVDIIHYPFLPIELPTVVENIRFYSNADIAAMKIQDILGRGKKKDFWDLFELLKHYPLQQIIEWHKQKFPSQMLAISIPHALTYFIDAEESETPVSFKNQTWDEVKKGIQLVVREYLK
jgi:predicted nucleotidyltransferase component of viral defense system